MRQDLADGLIHTASAGWRVGPARAEAAYFEARLTKAGAVAHVKLMWHVMIPGPMVSDSKECLRRTNLKRNMNCTNMLVKVFDRSTLR